MIKLLNIEQIKKPKYEVIIDQVLFDSIKENGMKIPIVVDSNYTIIDGHQRYFIAKELGMTEIYCNIKDGDENIDQLFKRVKITDPELGLYLIKALINYTNKSIDDLAKETGKPKETLIKWIKAYLEKYNG